MFDRTEILLEAGTNEAEFIEFYLAGNSYGINVAKVKSVAALSSRSVTPLPEAPPHLLGVVHHQDLPVRLIDLRGALGLDGESPAGEQQLILFTEFDRQSSAWTIDGIHKIHRTRWDRFQPMEARNGSFGASGYCTGTILVDGRIILILDMERLLLDFSSAEDREGAPEDSWDEPDKALCEARSSKRIVYAEDSSVVRSLTESIFRKAGYTQVASFDNGESADAYLRGLEGSLDGECPGVDVVVTDIEMPRMDGLTLCRQVKQRSGGTGAGIPAVIVYSSLINREMTLKCQSVGADAQISKPHGDEIIALVDRLCGLAAPVEAEASP